MDQFCSVSQTLESTILVEGGVGEEKVIWYVFREVIGLVKWFLSHY